MLLSSRRHLRSIILARLKENSGLIIHHFFLSSQKGACSEAIHLLKKCLAEDSGHSRAQALLSDCLTKLSPKRPSRKSKFHQTTSKITIKLEGPQRKNQGLAPPLASTTAHKNGSQDFKGIDAASRVRSKTSEERMPDSKVFHLVLDGVLASGG